MGFWVKKDQSTWAPVKKVWVKTTSGSGAWTSAKKIWVKVIGGWNLFWPSNGPYATTPPSITQYTNGTGKYTNEIIYGSNTYGQKGVWVANSSTSSISSYAYNIYTSDSPTPGGTETLQEGPTTFSGTYHTIDNTLYDGKYLIFEVVATRTDGTSGTDSSDTGNSIRPFVHRSIPVISTYSLSQGTGAYLNTITYTSQWDYSQSDLPDYTRATVELYRNSSSSTSGGTLVATGTSTDNGYTYTSSVSYDMYTDAVNNDGKYFYVVEKQYNSGTDFSGSGPVINTISRGPFSVTMPPDAFSYSIADTTASVYWGDPGATVAQSGNYVAVNWNDTAYPRTGYLVSVSGPVNNGPDDVGITSFKTYPLTSSGYEYATITAYNSNTYCTITCTPGNNTSSYLYSYTPDGFTRVTATTSSNTYKFSVSPGSTATVYYVMAYSGANQTGLSTQGTGVVSSATPTAKYASSGQAGPIYMQQYVGASISSAYITPSSVTLDTQNGNGTFYCIVSASGYPSPSIYYSWQFFSGGWNDLGVTTSYFTPSYSGYPFRCVVTALNAYGSQTVDTGSVTASWNPPRQLTGPSISGSGVAGTYISFSGGTYANGSSSNDLAESINPASFSSSSPSAASTSPYRVTTSDASSPAWYFASRDSVFGNNGSNYTYFSGSIMATLPPPTFNPAPPNFSPAPPNFPPAPPNFPPTPPNFPPTFFGPPRFGTSSIRFKESIIKINNIHEVM